MTKYTGTKTVKACPMSLGEAEKVLGRKIDTSAVENREETEGYLVEYAEDYLHNKTSYQHQGTHKPKERAVYEEAFMAGFDDGLNVSLDKQIEGGKKPTQAELFK